MVVHYTLTSSQCCPLSVIARQSPNTFKISYPFNSIILHAFFSNSDFHKLHAGALLDAPLNLSLPKHLPDPQEKVDIPFQMRLAELKRFMSNDRPSDDQWTETEADELFEGILVDDSPTWALITPIIISLLMAVLALILIARQRCQINTLMLSMAALEGIA